MDGLKGMLFKFKKVDQKMEDLQEERNELKECIGEINLEKEHLLKKVRALQKLSQGNKRKRFEDKKMGREKAKYGSSQFGPSLSRKPKPISQSLIASSKNTERRNSYFPPGTVFI
jgi:hypothetical protein